MLRSVYKVPREKLINVLVKLVQRRNILIFGLAKEVVIKGLLLCRPSGRVSLPDALIWAAAVSSGNGSAIVYSFDGFLPRALSCERRFHDNFATVRYQCVKKSRKNFVMPQSR